MRKTWLLVPATLVPLAGLAYGCGSTESATDGTSGAGAGATSSNTGGSSSGGAVNTGGSGNAATTGSGASAGSGQGASGQGASGQGASGQGGSGPQGLVRFVAFGDSGKGNQSQVDVANAVAAKCAQDGCDFVQLLGDNIYDSGVSSVDDPLWQTRFEQPYAVVPHEFWVVMGNHDYGGNGTGNEFGKVQINIDYSNVSTKWKLPAAYYHRTVEHVEFFGLDTNMAMYHQADDQTTEVNTWTTQSGATWRIAFGHHPYKSNGPHGNAGEYEGLPFIPIVNGAGVKDILEASVCGKVDLYMSGHDHSRQWLAETCNGTELIVSGGGASTTELEGDNITHFQADTAGFLYVRIENDTLTGEFVDTNGNVEFTRVLTK